MITYTPGTSKKYLEVERCIMNDLQGRPLERFWNTLRSLVSAEDYIMAAVLVDNVKSLFKDSHEAESQESVYAALLKVADQMVVINPFRDKEQFFLVYREASQFENFDWENAIAYMDSFSRLSVLPSVLVDVFAERFVNKPETVLIAEAEKFVPNLKLMVDDNLSSHFVLTTQNTVFEMALHSIFAGYENVEILQTSIYQYDFLNRRFDLIFASPIFGSRTLADEKSFICREFDLAALENLSLHLNNGGRLIITLPARVSFASDRVNDLRNFIQQTYKIKEISELPVGIIDGAAIKMYLLDIENTRSEADDDIVIRRYSGQRENGKKGRLTSLEVNDDTFVLLSELEEHGDWRIDCFFAQQDEDYQNYQNSEIRKEKLGNVAQVFRGKAVSKKDLSGNISVVNISNIREYDIDYDNLDHLLEDYRKVANYLLHEGDVLLPARGTAIRTAVFHDKPYSCIASSNIIVIRPNPKMLDGVFLKIFLDSPIGNKIISGTQQGMTVMNISYKDLNALEIPLPPLPEQKSVANEYLKELKYFRETIAAAEERWVTALGKLQTF